MSLSKKVDDGRKFVEIANIPVFEWCEFVRKQSTKTNPWIKRFMRMFKDQMPSLMFKPCPHTGRIEIKDFTVKNDLLMFAPTVYSYTCDIHKIENCSSTGGLNIKKCDLNDGKLNLYFSIEKTYKKSIHKISIFKKANGEKHFIEFANIPTFDWCLFVGNGKLKMSPWIKRFMKMFSAQLPSGLFKPCPLNGLYEIKNFTVKSDVFMFLPNGIIRYNHHWYSEKNETFMYLSILIAIDHF